MEGRANEEVIDLSNELAQLNARNEQTVEDACFHIGRKLAASPAYSFLLSPSGKERLSEWLAHPNDKVRVLGLTCVARCAQRRDGVQFLHETKILDKVVTMIVDASFNVAGYVIKALVVAAQIDAKTASHPSADDFGAKVVFDESRLSTLRDLLSSQQDESLRFRIFDLFVQLAAISDLAWQHSEPFLNELLALLQSHDILQQLNVVELAAKIAQIPQGIKFLQKEGAFTKFAGLLVSDDPMAYLLYPCVLGVFADLALQADAPEGMFEAQLFTALNTFLQSSDSTLATAAIGTIGRIASRGWGAQLLLLNYESILREWSEYLHSANSAFKASFLHSFAVALRGTSDESTQQIYTHVARTCSHKPLFQTLMKLLETPFEDLKAAAYDTLTALVQHKWGLHEAFAHPGFYEWLVARAPSTQSIKSVSEWHYALIAAVVQSVQSAPHFPLASVLGDQEPEQRLVRLQTYLREGVFYVPRQALAAVADETS